MISNGLDPIRPGLSPAAGLGVTLFWKRICTVFSCVAYPFQKRLILATFRLRFQLRVGYVPVTSGLRIGYRAAGASHFSAPGNRLDTFALLTTIWPALLPARSTPGEPGRPANRQAFASSSYPSNPQALHNRHIGRPGFLVSKSTPARRLAAWATRGPADHTELPKTLRTIPTYSVYGTIARLLRASQEKRYRLDGTRAIAMERKRPATLLLPGNVGGPQRR